MSVKLNESQIKYLGINKKNDLSYNLEINGTTHTNGRIYSDEWIQFNEIAKGLYWPNGNNTHLYPNNVGSYGSLIVTGDRGGYNGILLGNTQDYMVVMSSLEHQGLFNQANNQWIVYYNKNNGRIGIGTSGLQAYNNTINGTSYFCNNTYTNGLITSYGGFFYQSSDATLKIYSHANNNTYGAECIAMQTCFDTADGSTHTYVTQYGYRCNLLLQPRGGQVLIRLSPTSDVDGRYPLQVGGSNRSALFQSTVDVGSTNSNQYAELNVCRMSPNGDHTGALHQAIQSDASFGQLLYVYDGSITSGFYFKTDRIQALKDIYGTLKGNADTATRIQTAGTTAQFYRGDVSWSNTLKQTNSATLGIDTDLKIGTAAKDLNFDITHGSGSGINDGNAGGITWGSWNSSGAAAGIYYQTSGHYGSRLLFGTTHSYAAGVYARMIIDHVGNVGIGTLTPSYKLHVVGNIKANAFYSSSAFTLTAGKVAGFTAGHAGLYGNGIAISNPATANDMGWVRMTGTGESDSILEIAVGDDGGGTGAESVVVRQYNTNNAIVKEAYLLNPSGNTSFPGTVTAPTFIGALNGNAATASIWQTARTLTIGNTGKSVNGGSNVSWTIREIGAIPHFIKTSATNADTLTITGYYSMKSGGDTNVPSTGHSMIFVDHDVGTPFQIYMHDTTNTIYKRYKNNTAGTWNAWSSTLGNSISGNAATATQLLNARTINGTSFNGTANITTANWGTARTLTIGNKGQSVNGSGNVSWTLHDILYSGGISSTSSWDITNPGVYYVAPASNSTAYSGTGNPETNTLNNGTLYRWGQLIVSRANTGGLAQFYISHQDSTEHNIYGIHFRTGWNSSYLGTWRVLLDSVNYTNWCDGRYINTSGDTLTGALNFKNSTWNLLGDDVYFGDNDTAGSFAIKGANGSTNFKMVTYNGTSYGTITWNGSSFTFSNSVVIGSGAHYYMTYNSGAYYVLHNHNNGNISLNAASGGLYIGYFNTGSLNFGPEAQWGYVTASSGWVFSLGITAANVTSNGRAYMNEWIQFNTNNGLYWPNHYSIHICGNDVSTYGGVRIRGAKNGYHGIICGDSSIHLNIMSSDEHQGLYNESNSRWIVYYSRSNNIMALGGSDISAGYTVNVNGSLYIGGSQGVYTTTYYSNAITTVGNTGVWTTAPTYTHAIINFGYRAHDPVSSYGYTPWFGGVDAVNGYGYGATVTAGLYHGSDPSNGGFYIGTSWDGNGNDTFFRFSRTGTLTAVKVYGAVWNDYAEYREQIEELKPGQVAYCGNDGKLKQTTERLQKFEGVVSDTYGFAIGETDSAKTPLAVSGRVLVYTYEDRSTFNSGDCVCAAPNGQVSKMTREEITYYPDRIVGVVSEIPDYEVWGTGNVDVDNRIWIKVK